MFAIRRLCALLSLLCLLTAAATPAIAQDAPPAPMPVAPHEGVGLEWWYLNAHATTGSGRHLAMIVSFFRIAPRSTDGAPSPVGHYHYLIYAVTDEDAKTHVAVSMADQASLNLLQQLAEAYLAADPTNKRAQQLVTLTGSGHFPPPTQTIAGKCTVVRSPFSATYGTAAQLTAVPDHPDTYHLLIGSSESKPQFNLIFSGQRPYMKVGGTGNTGIYRPQDMKYVSLTQCNVTGFIDTGSGLDTVTSGEGWFDHQWGDSWSPQVVGWDWYGLQLEDGRDILLFRERSLATGKYFAPMATIEDASGNLIVTKHVLFTPDHASDWTSTTTGAVYPLDWQIDLPDNDLHLSVAPVMNDQEMPVMAGRGSIWEGSVDVTANGLAGGAVALSTGKGYMELVGYGPAAHQRSPMSK
jgi:predicted secreted hydrolase